MEKQTGCVHIYCGDGKGKTTCGMGLCTRAAGYGYRVLIYQFMKDNERAEGALTVAECDVCAGAGQDKVFVSDDTGGEGRAETVL